jgi:CMP-N-acetylneuraminic acid synthetase
MRIVALIPLRWWSKSIPYKNIKELWWKPLCNWVIEASKWSKYINETFVSTDDEKIKNIVEKTWIKIINRPIEFAQDDSSTESVILHFMKNVDFDILITIQATSPFTTSDDLDKAIEQFIEENNDSMLTWVLLKKFYWSLNWNPLNYDYKNRPRRQEFDWVIEENWAFYITKKSILEKNKNRLWWNIWIYKMDENKGIDIDEPSDWVKTEEIINLKKWTK